MSDPVAAEMIAVLRRIESKLDRLASIESVLRELKNEFSSVVPSIRPIELSVSELQHDLNEVKVELCGFKHEGRSILGLWKESSLPSSLKRRNQGNESRTHATH